MFKFPDWCYTKLPSQHYFWIALWLVWFTTLWILSSGTPDIKNAPKIPHLDKVVHFCYYMAGGFCLANFLHLKNACKNWRMIILFTFCIGSIVGGIDEYHQTFTPGRTGNDLGDWLSDAAGTLAGAYYCFFMWLRLENNNTPL